MVKSLSPVASPARTPAIKPIIRLKSRYDASNSLAWVGPAGFRVPARYAAALIERARKGPALAVDKAKEEVGRQLDGWQAAFYGALQKEGFRSAAFGP